MKAMILAAGYGTRLRPLTNNTPKALIEIAHVPMLEILLKKLISWGITEIVINVHHHAKKITDFLNKRHFIANIQISFEEKILGTGGGLKHVEHFFDRSPFLLHNVDVFSNLDLNKMLASHMNSNALATLAIQKRETKRHLLFDDDKTLCGRNDSDQNNIIVRQPKGRIHPFAFNGIHIISPKIFPLISETGYFSIIDSYLRIAAAGGKFTYYNMEKDFWLDLGNPKSLEIAEKVIAEGRIKI
jgi:NDP-sugar pyrophosphorylase family protein